MTQKILQELIDIVKGSIEADSSSVKVTNPALLKETIGELVQVSSLDGGAKGAAAQFLIRGAALDLGIVPSSINDIYMSRGKGNIPPVFTVPAINLRVLTFDAARAVFKQANQINAGTILFEIARSEIGYTNQRPTEYMASILAAAIAEGFSGPVFVQGDHFQISLGRFKNDPEQEIQAVKDITAEAIHAGFYNIDVDTSTLVDLDKDTIPAQQELNSTLSAELTAYIRSIEPEGITISVGGEIGEVGGHNSTKEELKAYTDGYYAKLKEIDPSLVGLSKISIQTGTSHGGVVLPDGSIAKVSVDFDTLLQLSRVAREEYGMAGAVQHGASTLPQDAFGKFVESEACEVHLATNFQNMFYDYAPEALVKEIYAYLDKNNAGERKPDMTDDQFYYKTRKRAIGAFKKEIMSLPDADKKVVSDAWQKQFAQLFESLAIADTRKYVEQAITPIKVLPSLDTYLALVAGEQVEEDTSDLAD